MPFTSCYSARSRSWPTRCSSLRGRPEALDRLANATSGEETGLVERRPANHRHRLVQRSELEVRVRSDRETRTEPLRALEELAVRDAVGLVHLDRDVGIDARPDETFLPFRGERPLGVAERRKGTHRGVPEDVDALGLDALADDLERALSDAALQVGVEVALGFAIRVHAAFEERAGVVVADPLTGRDLDLVQCADDVMERVARRWAERRRDAEVELETDAQAQARGVVEVAQHIVVVTHLLLPRVVVGDAVRADADGLRATLEAHRAVAAIAVDVMVEQLAYLAMVGRG